MHANMFPTNLNTNEVKDSAGTEVEFLRQSVSGRQLVFAQSGEAPNLEHRITVSHNELSSGDAARRRSMVRVDQQVEGASGTKRTISAYCVVDAPIGDLANYDDVKDTVANLLGLLATTGSATTVLFDCSGYGADALVNGTL